MPENPFSNVVLLAASTGTGVGVAKPPSGSSSSAAALLTDAENPCACPCVCAKRGPGVALRAASPVADGGLAPNVPLIELRGLATWGVRAPLMLVLLAGRTA